MSMSTSLRRGLAALTLGLVALGGAPALQAGPKIQSWETPNGARVLFVPAPDLPMLDARVVFAAGSARDGANHNGLP